MSSYHLPSILSYPPSSICSSVSPSPPTPPPLSPLVSADYHSYLHSLSFNDYLERFEIKKYLSDVIAILYSHAMQGDTGSPLSTINSISKSNGKSSKNLSSSSSSSMPSSGRRDQLIAAITEYFSLLSNGRHLIGRSFKFINQGWRNRKSFIFLFECSYKNIPPSTPIQPEGFHDLCTALCHDFPYSLVRNASRITVDIQQNSSDSSSSFLPLSELSLKFFILFFFSEFMNQAALAFRTLDYGGYGKIKPTKFRTALKAIVAKGKILLADDPLNRWAKSNHTNTATAGGGGASKVTEIVDFISPPMSAIDDVLITKPKGSDDSDDEEEMMFNTFCVKLFQHPAMHAPINTPLYFI